MYRLITGFFVLRKSQILLVLFLRAWSLLPESHAGSSTTSGYISTNTRPFRLSRVYPKRWAAPITCLNGFRKKFKFQKKIRGKIWIDILFRWKSGQRPSDDFSSKNYNFPSNDGYLPLWTKLKSISNKPRSFVVYVTQDDRWFLCWWRFFDYLTLLCWFKVRKRKSRTIVYNISLLTMIDAVHACGGQSINVTVNNRLLYLQTSQELTVTNFLSSGVKTLTTEATYRWITYTTIARAL